ncbi:MAG: hypothetical protein AB1847_10935 [bacterium]
MKMIPLALKKKNGKSLFHLCRSIALVLCILSLLWGMGCGDDNSGDSSDATVTANGMIVEVKSISLSVAPALDVNTDTTVEAILYDSDQNPVCAGVEVAFFTDLMGTSITPSSATTNVQGMVRVTFHAGSNWGKATITAVCGSVERKFIITINKQKSAGGSIEYIYPTEDDQRVLGVKGSGLSETVEVAFMVRDSAGSPVKDGTEVHFILLGNGGGEKLATDLCLTQEGQASTSVNSGTIAGTVAVTAYTEVNGVPLRTDSRVLIICAGPPDARHFSLGASSYNIAGCVHNDKETEITVRLADQYGNPVPAGTAVYFTTECGSITATAWTDAAGAASAKLTSQEPKPRTDGMATVMAYAVGQESFVDYNSNGVYDSGEPLEQDLSEPFLDENGGGYNLGEHFWDQEDLFPNPGQWDSGNGKWDRRLFIWGSIEILFSDRSEIRIYDRFIDDTLFCRGNIPTDPPPIAVNNYSGPSILIKAGQYKDFYIVVSDRRGNPLVDGTQVKIDLVTLITTSEDPNAPSSENLRITGETENTIEETPEPCHTKKLFMVRVFNTNANPSSITWDAQLRVKVIGDDNKPKELRLPLEVE